MKFIDFLNEGFSDREDYNDFLSFYKKIIKSYNNEEAVLSIPGVFSRKLKFVISDHGAARWMQRGHSENSNSTELKDFLKSCFEGCLKEFGIFNKIYEENKESNKYGRNLDPRVFCVSKKFNRSATIKLQRNPDYQTKEDEFIIPLTYSAKDPYQFLVIQINEVSNNKNYGTELIFCENESVEDLPVIYLD